MFRGLVLATLLDVAQSQMGPGGPGGGPACPDCNFDVTKMEEFTVDYHGVKVNQPDVNFQTGAVTITTEAIPAEFPQEHGTIAVHARNLQLKVDSHAQFPTPFAIGPIPLSGLTIHEELHINGATGQASFHIASQPLNLCLQLDGLPPMAMIMHDQIEQHLQQAEQQGPMLAQMMFHHITLDGEDDMGPAPNLLFTESSHPAFIWPPPNPSDAEAYQMMSPTPPQDLIGHTAVKFDNYRNSVGESFVVRACEVSDHSSTQSLLAASPEARKFVANRIGQHQRRLQAMLEPTALNTRFNFIPLEIADLMVPEPQHGCSNDELAQMPSTAFSTLQVAALSVCAFVMGIAFAKAIRKKPVTSPDDYHQVIA